MKKLFLLVICYLFLSQLSFAQVDTRKTKGDFYFYWGYNRSSYSLSNLHFNGPLYDFTLYDLNAKDRPSAITWQYINPTKLSIPQYNVRMGYYFTDRFAISFGMDHMKYVITPDQNTLISGVITSEISEKYEGAYLNEPIQLSDDLLEFEHTDGFNLVSLEFEYLHPIFRQIGKSDFSMKWNAGLGGIWIVTKTKVKVLGEGLDNDFHVAGYTLAGKTGPRFFYKNKFFLLAEIKGGYASLPSVLIKNAEPEIGDHNLLFLEYYIALGLNFKLGKRKKESNER
jgi:hypothetical protein